MKFPWVEKQNIINKLCKKIMKIMVYNIYVCMYHLMFIKKKGINTFLLSKKEV